MPKTSFHSATTGYTPADPAPAAKAPDPWTVWSQDRSSKNFQSLAAANQNAIDAAIRTTGGDPDELRIPALKLLKKAADTYNPSAGASFGTHAHNWLKGLQRSRWEREFVMNTPERARILQGRISSFKREFESENGREPEDDEVFSALGVTERQARRAARTGMEAPESATQTALGTTQIVQRESDHDMMLEALYEDAAADEDRLGQAIIKHYFGYGNSPLYSQTDIARAHGVSPVAVHKRIKKLKTIVGDWGGR